MQQQTTPHLKLAIDQLSDSTFITPLARSQNYIAILNELKLVCVIDVDLINRLLTVSTNDINHDVKYAAEALNIITVIATKYTVENSVALQIDLVPSVIATVNLLHTIGQQNKNVKLKKQCLETLISFPNKAIITVVSNHSLKVLNLLNDQLNHNADTITLLCKFFHRVINIMPEDKKKLFLETGLYHWFHYVIPKLLHYTVVGSDHIFTALLEFSESLTKELADVNYSDNQFWKCEVLVNICNAQKFPAVLQTTLTSGTNTQWHRIWIILVKLLKNQITLSYNKIGSPINSILPVVELAFKMDVESRCKAFQCWNVLIDNFSTETNEILVNKRLKLLIIPLRSNNAKTVETALEKLKTWWHLLVKFQNKSSKLVESVVIPFLHFCFGTSSDTNALVPGFLSDTTKTEGVQHFLEIIGHRNCVHCSITPTLEDKFLTTMILVDYWDVWMFSLKQTLRLRMEAQHTQQMKCLWKSYMKNIARLPANNVRKDLVKELLNMLLQIFEESGKSRTCVDVAYDALIVPLFKEVMISDVFIAKEREIFFNNVVKVVIDVYLQCSTQCMDRDLAVMRMRNFFSNVVLVNLAYIKYSKIGNMFNDLSLNNVNVILWTALVESLVESSVVVDEQFLLTIWKWPLKDINMIEAVEFPVHLWYTFYNMKFSLFHNTNMHKDLLSFLMEVNYNISSAQFMLYALIALLKYSKIDGHSLNYASEINILQKLLILINNKYNKVQEIYPQMVMIVKNILQSATCNMDEVTKLAFDVAALVLQFTDETSKHHNSPNSIILIEKLLHSVNDFVTNEYNPELVMDICDLLYIYCDTFIKMQPTLKPAVITTLKTFIYGSTKIAEHVAERLMSIIKEYDDIGNTAIEHSTKEIDTTEKSCTPSKDIKRTGPTIVHTIVDNGEEFVIVKSNWKFDPRKLTDAQKEKYKQKKDDIPALYQDLSQSQDDCRLRSWRTDSQDASSTSNSVTNNTKPSNVGATVILKGIAGTEVVPKIIDNILGKKSNTPSATLETQNKPEKHIPQLSNLKDNTLRLSIKDKICKNVKVLVESLHSKHKSVDLDNTTNKDVTTPLSKEKREIQKISSAPPVISLERLPRTIRLPKKFADAGLSTLKKKRQCLNDSHTDQVSSDVTKDPINSLTIENCDENILEDKVPRKPLLVKSNVCQNNAKVLDQNKPCEIVSTPEVLEPLATNLHEVVQEQCHNLQHNVNTIKANVNDKNISNIGNNNVEVLTTPVSAAMKNPKKRSYKKRTTSVQSRIEKSLAINMVEGHPFLQSDNYSLSIKRTRRKSTVDVMPSDAKRKTLKDKPYIKRSHDAEEKAEKNYNSQAQTNSGTNNFDFVEQEPTCSEDIIESSQDSTLTTISVKSNKSKSKRNCLVKLLSDTPNILENYGNNASNDSNNANTSDDISLPQNKTVDPEPSEINLTEDMDTQSINANDSQQSGATIIADKNEKPINVNISQINITDSNQCTPNADTEPIDSQDTAHADTEPFGSAAIDSIKPKQESTANADPQPIENQNSTAVHIQVEIERFKNEDERKIDFLNDTLQISPIQTMSPIRDKHLPSPETSSDYVVITLSSPVLSNGVPIDKSDSPEIFTGERDGYVEKETTPPRDDIPTDNNISPNSALSLKKNKPQVRPGGRAAHMLGLCIPDRLQTLNSCKTTVSDETKKGAKRNLKTLYNSVSDSEEVEDNEQFLKLRRSLPPCESSPVGPILKRKLADITDDAMPSPANKKKRVSFHDPPVSTTVAIQNYIEPCGIRSPQSSLLKRQERVQRPSGVLKSPRRLDTVFKMDNLLTKATESFTELDTANDSDASSLDQTPAMEIVVTSELNNKDPICPELVDCTDPIENIATELSSAMMKESFVKSIEGNISTIGDLAKSTELEVNRLCIKTPKIKVAKKALTDYACKMANIAKNKVILQEKTCPVVVDVEVQTNVLVNDALIQPKILTSEVSSQTETTQLRESLVQTYLSSYMTTDEIITSHVLERPDYIDCLGTNLRDEYKQQIAATLPLEGLIDVVSKKTVTHGAREVLFLKQGDLKQQISYLKDFLCEKYSSNDIVLICSELLTNIHKKA